MSAGPGDAPAVSLSSKVCCSPRGSQASKALALNGIATAHPLRQRRFQGIESLQRRLVLIGPEWQRLWHIGKLSQRGVAVRGQRSGVTALRPILGPLSLVCYSDDQHFGFVCPVNDTEGKALYQPAAGIL